MKKFKRAISILAVGLMLTSVFIGCGTKRNPTTTSQPTTATITGTTTQGTTTTTTGTKKIGLVLSTLNNPFFVSMKNGAQKRATELGHTLVVFDSQNDSAKESSNIEDLISQKVDILLINPTDSGAVVNSVKSANAKKIPVITLDRASNGGVVATHIASDNVAGGKMAADFLVTLLKGKGNVVELQGIAGTSAARDRGKGFDDQIATSTNIKIIAKQAADFDRAKGLSVMENILQAQPKIDAVFAHNDEMALGAVKAIEASKRSGIVVVGFDAVEDAVKAVQEGKMAATVAQQPELIGSMGIDNADKVLKNQTVSASIPVTLKLITK